MNEAEQRISIMCSAYRMYVRRMKRLGHSQEEIIPFMHWKAFNLGKQTR